MDRLRDAVSSRMGRVVAVGLLLLGVVTAVPAFSASASAHQSHIDASVSCDGEVSWTTKSWSSGDEGSHGDVRVWSEDDGGESHDLEHGSFSGDNGYQFSGSFEWPDGVSSMRIHSTPNGAWGNGETSDDDDEITITKPEDCDHHPEVGSSFECEDSAPGYGDGAATFTLTNPAGPFGHDADFSLSGPDGQEGGDYHVPSGEHEQVTYHGLSDGHHTVHVKVGDDEHDEEFDIDCDESMPSVETSQACVAGDGAITVNLANTGGDAVEFTVEHPVTGEVEHLTLQPNQSVSRTFSGLADGDYVVPVYAGEQELTKQFTVDCDDDEGDDPDDECPSDDESDSSYGASGGDSSSSSTDGEEPSSTETDDEGDCESEPPAECPDDGGDDDHDGSSTSTSTDTEGSYGVTRYSSTSSSSSTSSTEYEGSSSTDHDGSSSTDGEDHDGDDHDGDGDDDCDDDDDAEGAVQVSKACVDHDGQVTITLVHVSGEDDLDFVVNGVTYTVRPGDTKDIVVGGLPDGTHHFSVMAGGQDLSFDVTVDCDLEPTVTVSQQCVDFDGSLSLVLKNLGDDVDAVFTIDDIEHVVAPLGSETVTFAGLPDGTTTITLAINGVEQPDIVASFDCDPAFDVVAECNTIGSDGEVQVFWFTITNNESTSVDVAWDGGTATVPAGESRTVATTSAVISLTYDGVEIASAQATNVVCSRTVTVQKQVIGEPQSPETYTVTIYRVTGETRAPEVIVDLVAGETKTVALPSTLDPAGIQYSVVETATGTAVSSVVTPDSLTLSGHLGQTISIVVTNGYSQILPPPPPPPAGSTTTTTTTPGATTTTVRQGGPVPPTTTVPKGPLPVSGGTPLPTLLIGFGLSALGTAMLMVRRRPATR